MAMKKKYSQYDLNSYLYSLTQRVATTVNREGGFGNTEFSCCDSPDDFKKIKTITRIIVVDKITNRIALSESVKDIVDWIVGVLFPNVKMEKLIEAIKGSKLSYQGYETNMIPIAIEDTIPFFITAFVAQVKRGDSIPEVN